jgi:para-nitrobenzyl esterase
LSWRSWRLGVAMKRVFSSAVGLSALVLAVLVVPSAAGGADPLTVHTSAGDVQGISSGAFHEWRGVPYAAPPLGSRRWRPPAPVSPWSGVRLADTFAPQCLQLGLSAPVEGSEDCLYLNVFAPAASGSRRPVMVHLHGGSNFFFHPYTNAKALVQRGVVVVTVGYQLGVFGFAGHPALTAEGGGSSGEYGLLDQIAALHWVQDNISAFGGDPGNVTLFGESAGSFDAVAIAASPLGRGLFSRLAAQTESFWAARGADRIADAEDFGLEVAQKVGCSDAADVAACLRAKPADELVLAAGVGEVTPWVGGVVLPRSPLELIAAQARPVPMLLGSNREEAVFFLAPEVLPGDPYPLSAWVRDTNAVVGPLNGDKARSLYPLSQFDSAFWSTIGLFTDAVHTCPIRRLALASSGPVYRYLFTHRYQNDPLAASFRAAHFFDDPLLWHDSSLLENFLGLPGYQFSSQEEALAARMAAYWTNFAKTGDPNGLGLPLWRRYTSSTERTNILDEPAGEVTAYRLPQCTFLDPLPVLFGRADEYTPRPMIR